MNKFVEVEERFKKHDGETIIPVRSTKGSAGYDIYLKEDLVIPATKIVNNQGFDVSCSLEETVNKLVNILKTPDGFLQVEYGQVLTWTDLGIVLDEDKYLSIVPRSSVGTKLGISLANTEGVIDSDYITNEATGGNIGLCLKNLGNKEIVLKKGERIAQAKILKYFTVDDDVSKGSRTGGFGSSGK